MDPYLSACTAGAPLNPSSPLPFRRSVAGCHASASRQVPHQLSEHHARARAQVLKSQVTRTPHAAVALGLVYIDRWREGKATQHSFLLFVRRG
jgi:hypothetical protein